MYRCRAITPPLYNTKRKNGYPTFCSAATFFGCPANYVPHFPDTRVCRPRKCGASADRENTAKTAMSKTVFGWPAALNLSTACHDGVGWGGIKGEKERFVFERFFVGTERRKPLFDLLLIYTAKNGKT